MLLVAFSMAELTSAMPTAGGPYWWSAKLGSPGWSWITGWFNIVGLVGIVAGVGYGAAFFLQAVAEPDYGLNVLGINFATANPKTILHETWLLFLIILIGYTVVNIFADRLLAIFNNISVGWHVLGVLVIIALVDRSCRATIRAPASSSASGSTTPGFHGGATSGGFFWLYVLPLGFILTMYTQTGYDASAHTAEETRGAAKAAAQGVWRSVFYSAIAGWALLLALLFAATHVAAITKLGGGAIPVVETGPDHVGGEVRADHLHRRAAVLRRRGPDERVAHVVRVLARPRDARLGAVPASHRQARAAVRGARRLGRLADHHDPGLLRQQDGRSVGVLRDHGDLHRRPVPGLHHPGVPAAADGRQVRAGPVDARTHYKWVNIGAIAFVVLVVYSLDGPTTAVGAPWNNGFTWTAFNYSPLVLLVGADRRDLVVARRQEPLPRPGAHDRRRRVRRGRAADGCRPAPAVAGGSE